MKEEHKMYWNGTLVGTYTIEGSDMWYYDGTFVPGNSETAAEFHRIITALPIERTFVDFSKGVLCELHPENNSNGSWNAAVLGFTDDVLNVRMVFQTNAFQKNNPGKTAWTKKLRNTLSGIFRNSN